MYISVYYQEKRDMGTITNIDGEYSLEARRNGGTLVFSAVGYISKTVRVGSNNQTVNVKLAPDNVLLNEVVVKPQKEKYSRKNNPAVEFMKKVIEHKKAQVLEVNEYYQYDKYEKMKHEPGLLGGGRWDVDGTPINPWSNTLTGGGLTTPIDAQALRALNDRKDK